MREVLQGMLLRTTTAPTIIHSGVKDNVVPTKAEAVVNFRVLPGETTDDVLNHIEKVISDKRVKIIPEADTRAEPAPVSPSNVAGFKNILKTILQVYPEAVVAPTLMIATSDSKHFSAITKNIYRFAPFVVDTEIMASIHGLNEKTVIEDYKKGITFYYQLIKNSN